MVSKTGAAPDSTSCMHICRLATEALTKGSGDNITVIVAFLKPVDTLESIFKGGQQKHAATSTFYSSRYSSICMNVIKMPHDSVCDCLQSGAVQTMHCNESVNSMRT